MQDDPRLVAIERLVVRMFTALWIDDPNLHSNLQLMDDKGVAVSEGWGAEVNHHVVRLLDLALVERGRLGPPA